MEQFVGSVPNPKQGTPSVGAPVGADYSGGALPLEGATTPGTNPPSSNWPYTKRAINPPCSITLSNGTVLPTLVEIHNVQVEGRSCDELGSIYPNICDWTFNVCNNRLAVDCHHTATYPDTMHKFHAEIDMNWTFYKLAPPVPTTGYQVDVQGFAFWDDEHVSSADHSYSGWELHPLSAWRITNSTGSKTVNMAASPSSIGPVGAGTPGNSTITVTSLNGFTGSLNFSTITPYSSGTVASASYVTASCNPATVNLASGGKVSSVCSFNSSQPGSFNVMVLGSNSSMPTSSVTLQFSAIPDFSLSTNPTSVTVNTGSPGTSTVTVSALSGFAGVVNLVTNSTSCFVSPTSLTGSGSSTLSCTFSSAKIVQVSVSGTSGTLSHSATVNFTVRDFTISASPTSVNVNAGATATSTITIAPLNGFSGTITLAVTTNSTNLVCSLTATSITGGSGTSTLSCHGSPAGNYNAAVAGTSGTLSHTSNIVFHVQDFTAIASNTSVSVNVGLPGRSTFTVAPVNGFTGTVTLAVTTNSTNLSCNLSSTTTSGGSGTSTLSCIGSVAGNYLATVTGTNSTLSHSVTIVFHVQEFTVTASPTTVNVNAGATTTSTITVAPVNGFAGTVTLAVTTNSTNLVCTLSATSITGGPGTSTMSCHGTLAGNYNATVTGTSGTLTHTAKVVFSVQDFTVTASATSVTVNTGVTSTSTITIAPLNGYSGIVTLTVTTNSTSLSCILSSTSIAGGSGTSTLSCSASVAGNYLTTVTGTTASLSHSAIVTFIVQDFSIKANPTSVAVNAAASITSTTSVAPMNGFTGTIIITVATNSTSLSCALASTSITKGSGTSTLACFGSVAGNYLATVSGTSGSLTHSVLVYVVIRDFNITTNPSSITSTVGSAPNSTLIIASLGGFSGSVTLTTIVQCSIISGGGGGGDGRTVEMTPLPSCPTPSLSPAAVSVPTGGSVFSALTADGSGTPAGNYTITVIGTSGNLVHFVLVNVTFTGSTVISPLSSLTNDPGSKGGVIVGTAVLTFEMIGLVLPLLVLSRTAGSRSTPTKNIVHNSFKGHRNGLHTYCLVLVPSAGYVQVRKPS